MLGYVTYMSSDVHIHVMYMKVHRNIAVWRKLPIIINLPGSGHAHTGLHANFSPKLSD